MVIIQQDKAEPPLISFGLHLVHEKSAFKTVRVIYLAYKSNIMPVNLATSVVLRAPADHLRYNS